MNPETPIRMTVLLSKDQFKRLDEHCALQGYKKSTLVARLIREYLKRAGTVTRRHKNLEAR